MQQTQKRERRRVFKVFTIIEKPGSDRGYWLEIGVGSQNRDGSLSVKLDALPFNGMMQIREHEPRKSESTRPSGDQQPPVNGWRQNGGIQ
jgi:hypothetical protein